MLQESLHLLDVVYEKEGRSTKCSSGDDFYYFFFKLFVAVLVLSLHSSILLYLSVSLYLPVCLPPQPYAIPNRSA